MTCEVIDCKMLFDAIKENRNRFYIANLILMLDIGYESKIKVAKHLIKEEDGFDWFMEQLQKDEFGDDDAG